MAGIGGEIRGRVRPFCDFGAFRGPASTASICQPNLTILARFGE
jgi:hypothetical protein